MCVMSSECLVEEVTQGMERPDGKSRGERVRQGGEQGVSIEFVADVFRSS